MYKNTSIKQAKKGPLYEYTRNYCTRYPKIQKDNNVYKVLSLFKRIYCPT